MEEKKNAEWLATMSVHFPKTTRKYHGTVVSQLRALSSGIKPGFLWDIPITVSACQLVLLLASLRQEGLVAGDVRVVLVAGDILLINVPLIRERITRHLENAIGTSVYQFVDLSGSELMALSPESVLYTKVHQMLSLLLARLDLPESEAVISVPLEEDWCVNTVVGVLIGYPVVYWYFGSEPASLSMVPLTVFELSAESEDRRYVIYDFSIPSSIAATFELHIRDWHSHMLVERSHFTQMKLATKQVTMPHVMF